MDNIELDENSNPDVAPVDEIDGGVTSCFRRQISEEEEYINRFEKDLNLSKSEKYAEFYNFDYRKNGYLLILAHSTFDVGKKPRIAVKEDVKMLEKTFKQLNFKIDTYYDLKKEQLQSVIEKVSMMNFDNYGSFAIAVSSHGDDNGHIFAKDGTYDPETELFDPFKKVQSLYGKPKMFFIQSCRGYATDGGVTLLSPVETDGSYLEEYKIPREADMLIVYATVDGHIAFFNEDYGSQFFIHLTRTLKEFGRSRDLMTILTLANQRLSIRFTSKNYKEPQYDNKKQCMCIMNTLTRKILFKFD